MSRLHTEKLDDEDQTIEGSIRFNSFVNNKNQGVIIAVRDTTGAGKFAHWLVENDPFNKTYPNSDLATVAAAAQNTGRKVELKDKNKRKAKAAKYGKK